VNLATREFSIQNGVLVSSGIVMGVSVWLLALSGLLHRGRKYITPAIFGYVSAVAGLVLIGFGLSFGYRIALKFF
jgi:xanthine/uracil permease